MKVSLVKSDFPIFDEYPNLVYLDNAATSQKPHTVIDAVKQFYVKYNANIHRGIYKLSENATQKYENVRSKVAGFIGCDDPKEIIFTKNTNEAINLIVYGWARVNLKKGDIVVLSEMEHHANIVPWIRLKQELGINLYFVPLTSDYGLDYKKILAQGFDLSKIKLVSIAHVSNVLGTINPVSEIVKFLKENKLSVKVCIDAAQSVPHLPIDIRDLDCDFLTFSAHKMLGPSGVGVLWARLKLLESMEPFLAGSHMILKVFRDNVIFADFPDKFEAGTANLEGVVGFGAAIDYLNKLGMQNVFEHDQTLMKYGLQELSGIDGLKLFGLKEAKNRIAIFSFGFEGIHPHDIAQILDEDNIAIRSGHHCAQPLMDSIKQSATARASCYIYNSKEDLDKLVMGLKKVKQTLGI
ncbi:cysteine desulfurase [Candidatus Daviesbacteria bacterium]|nr:cysteine desulfurase [Candidatus Daviesbacteria bacterium]